MSRTQRQVRCSDSRRRSSLAGLPAATETSRATRGPGRAVVCPTSIRCPREGGFLEVIVALACIAPRLRCFRWSNARTKPPRFVTLRQAGAAGADTASLVTTGESLVAIHNWTFPLGPGLIPGVNARARPAVSAGSPTCAAMPATSILSATYRHPAHPSSANATSSRPTNRASQARECAVGRRILPRLPSPVTVSR